MVLGAFYRRLAARIGKAKAVTATASKSEASIPPNASCRAISIALERLRLTSNFGVHSSARRMPRKEKRDERWSDEQSQVDLGEAVKQVKAGRPAAGVKKALGIPSASLTNWVRADAKGPLGVSTADLDLVQRRFNPRAPNQLSSGTSRISPRTRSGCTWPQCWTCTAR